MTISTTIDKKNNIAYHKAFDVLTVDEIEGAINNLFNNPDFDPSMNILAEIQPGCTSSLGSDEVHNLVTLSRNLKNRSGPGRTAVVVSDNADYGIFHVLEFLLKDEARKLKVFKSLESGQEWLSER